MLYWFYPGTGLAAALGLVLFKTKEASEEGRPLPLSFSVGWWVLDAAWKHEAGAWKF